jgi:hypothetical protein
MTKRKFNWSVLRKKISLSKKNNIKGKIFDMAQKK